MPAARESLLNAALAAVGELPWSAVRMVDVAAAAGVSRQTLYNEFGSKDGLARALVRREADRYLRGVERLLGQSAGAADGPSEAPASDRLVSDRLASVAEWTVGEARARPLLRALLTGCWGERLPAPEPVRGGAVLSRVPAQRRADAKLPVPAEIVAAVRERSLVALRGRRPGNGPRPDGTAAGAGAGAGERAGETADLPQRCELAVRLALSYVVAPAGESIGRLVRAAVGDDVTATSPRAGDR
ncbi:TetR/AcrR family transcriptional regulator [Streptomyces peucetius]|uniref:TetR/AcrR family transcriptional regulator n=1 Tax=Streptomyces peucetius TaxID=1950 RepID=A0ABY6IEC2_STRPE|nr:TetR/AcrR family transcriptional regulator [Streptomyces peucetius]UYQ64294.1 TetR/AcrR family transcriptional regulator [Streptomyces peucetius]